MAHEQVFIVGVLGIYPDIKTPTYTLSSSAFSTAELAEEACARYRRKYPDRRFALLAWSRSLWIGDVDLAVEDDTVAEWVGR